MSRIIKSKFYKPFISLLVAVILIFSYEVNRPKAIVPIVIWGAGILAGVIAEEMLEMGIKHATGSGKTTKKGKAGKIADEILDSLDYYDFDNTNPTRKADGSLEVNMSANDRAKIARKIADEFGDVITEDEQRTLTSSNPKVISSSDSADPMYQTGGDLRIVPWNTNADSIKAHEMLTKLYTYKFTPVPYEKKTKVEAFSEITGNRLFWFYMTEGSVPYYTLLAHGNNITSATPLALATRCFGTSSIKQGDTATTNNLQEVDSNCDEPTNRVYWNYLKALEIANTKIYTSKGLVVPATLKNVYKVGDGYNGDNLPNGQALSKKPFKIPNFFPSSESDSDVEWEVVQQHYDNDVTNNQTKIDNEYETYLENGDINNVNNNYTTQTINNYYTDTTYPVKSGSIEIDIDIDIDNGVVVPPSDGDDGGGVADGESAPVIDRTLITYAKQTYDYLGDSIDGAIVSMKDITDDASGLVDYLDTSFRWLPAEWRALFGSAFILGVFAHFMRR